MPMTCCYRGAEEPVTLMNVSCQLLTDFRSEGVCVCVCVTLLPTTPNGLKQWRPVGIHPSQLSNQKPAAAT